MDEDMILPEGFEETPSTEAEEQQDDAIELDNDTAQETIEADAEDTKPADETTESEAQEAPSEPRKLKVTYNSEEREVSDEEAIPLIQKGMNYEKAMERAAREAKDALFAELNLEWNGQPIKSEADYKQAMIEKEIIDKYPEASDELRQELLQSRLAKEQDKTREQEAEQQKKADADYAEFVAAYPDVDPKSIKPETWEKVNNGTPLRFAYMEQERADLQNRIKMLEQKQQNQQKAPVRAVTNYGSGEAVTSDPFLEGFDS